MALPYRFCVTTVTSGPYQHYLPIFYYTLRKFVPDAIVKTFHRGKLDDITLNGLHFIQDLGMRINMPIENYAIDFPHNLSTTNCLRFLMSPSYFQEDYVYITDVDFVYLEHDPSIDKYYVDKLRKWKQPYWARRGFKRILGTDEKAKRIAGGGVLVTPEWFSATAELRKMYLEEVKDGTLGKVREDDERMLWYMCAGSDLKVPTKRGNKRGSRFKEIHIGDCKFQNRWTNENKMKRKISKGNFYKWHRLEEDQCWKAIVDICCKCDMVKQSMSNLREYMNNRKAITFDD